ncbi:MAG: acyltransferase [Candidatus Amulumruptor caecigallinarius]|nr:acyltransferase [Candidatus Amulumruptor caecigallinarius]MCM1396659.1 acyltransferase [Candidatus Amulumruptor caecigallinarius]MCM1453283.1 acyltransferase [bacterium]
MTGIKPITPPQSLSAATQRQEWIDCLRGITMLMVVLVHCENELFGWHYSQLSALSSFGVSFRMPMFFFISGFFAYSRRITLNAGDMGSAVVRRMKMTLTPTLIFLLLSFAFFQYPAGVSFYELLSDPAKHGAWFTIVAFDCFAIAIPFVGMLNSQGIPRRLTMTLMLIVAVCSLFVHHTIWHNHLRLGQWFAIISNPLIFELLFYFLIGMITRVMLLDRKAPYVPLWVALVLLASSFAVIYWGGPLLSDRYYDWRISPFVVMFILGLLFLFAHMRAVFNSRNRFGRSLSYLGRNTLQVYVMHLLIVQVFTLDVVQSFYPWPELDPNVMLPFNIALTIGITALCLYLDKLFARTRVYRYVYPKPQSRRVTPAAAAA